MPQQFNVLQCCSCCVFQVHQVKKSTKWQCKLCGQKQSVKRVFGQGSGVDCREHVQKLNLLRGQNDMERVQQNIDNQAIEQLEMRHSLIVHKNKLEGEYKRDICVSGTQSVEIPGSATSTSKWTIFLEKEVREDVPTNENLHEMGICLSAKRKTEAGVDCLESPKPVSIQNEADEKCFQSRGRVEFSKKLPSCTRTKRLHMEPMPQSTGLNDCPDMHNYYDCEQTGRAQSSTNQDMIIAPQYTVSPNSKWLKYLKDNH